MKGRVCGGQHWKNERCQMILYLDGEVVWSSFDQGNLLPGLTGNSEEEIEAFYEKYEKYEKKPLTSSPDIRLLKFRRLSDTTTTVTVVWTSGARRMVTS